ncbi:hypothetical protein HGO38_10485 [Rhizobium sp. CG5]|uniref:RcnB family protein n=1 Tax=Rhizobium sp. CG5 TaxID=2726076 RepID=UPI002033A317|nr:RcnB family protein [Rhizobium sp. CG5]MCM2473898.1 hypothetical protein [Rhizobium sp. CG5]
MNKMIVALMGASFLFTPAAFAQEQKKPPAGQQQQPVVIEKGKMLPADHRGQRVSDKDIKQRKLRNPGQGERWVEVDGTFVLINVATGMIVSSMGR